VRLFLILALVGCQSALPGPMNDHIGSGNGSDSVPPECMGDGDCVLAGASCCDCPTYATTRDDPAVRACVGVVCPPSSCPGNIRASCTTGSCVVACVPLPCGLSCQDGFAIDASGCEQCVCVQVASSQCKQDADCVRTRADCCGCAGGGSDTAVPASEVTAFDASLMCPPMPQCSGVDTCGAGLAPSCIQGNCELTPPLPPDACGRPNLPACPSGKTCTINASAAAAEQGVGVCM
jgi:hypothetical protein